MQAVKQTNAKRLVIAGGVGANSCLKETLAKECLENGIQLFHPQLSICTDNAAMVAGLTYHYFKAGIRSPLNLDAKARLPLDTALPFNFTGNGEFEF